MPQNPALIAVVVRTVRVLNPLITEFTLESADGGPLPGYTPGAHVRLPVQTASGQADWRHYSLINLDPAPGATGSPRHYRVAVRLEAQGRGGSRYLHAQLKPGLRIGIEAPRNDFPLAQAGGCTVLLAGGIGITPLLSMAACCVGQGAAVRLHYAGRSPGLMAYAGEARDLLGERLHLHADDEAGAPLDLDAVLAGCGPLDTLHVCGPLPLLDAVLARAQGLGWPRGRIHFELFSGAPAASEGADRPFEVCLQRSGRCHTVPAGRSILEVLLAQGCDPLYDCQRGECGVCAVPVLEGRPDHRDHVLTEAEKATGQVIQICVSRSLSPRLVLDL
ncbi:MAG: oxidoreductase [Curvibacter sp.]|nr:oxidoreductase [Curvibacter sp.]